MKKEFLPICFISFSMAYAAISAEEVPGDSIRYHLDPVVITASKMAESQREIAASITVINAENLSRFNSHSVLEAVQYQVPGLYLTERGLMGFGVAGGAAGGLSIRGMGGSPVTGVLVLRDGRPDMMGLMGHPLPDSYDMSSIERVEVVRGPASFLYGTNAMGGVINLVTRQRHDPGFETRFRASLGSYATRSAMAQHGGKQGRLDYLLMASYNQSDGHRAFSDYEALHYTFHGGYQAGVGTRFEANANWSDFNLFDPGTVSQPFSGHWYDIHRWGGDLSFSHTSRHGESLVRFHGNFGNHRIHDGFRSTDHTSGIMFYHTAQPWRDASLTAGFDWKSYGGLASNIISHLTYDEHEITEYAPYLHVQQLLLKRLLVSGGLRLEQHEVFGQTLLPKLGVVIHVTSATSLRFSLAKGFRSPTIRELYLFPAPTPDLQPEELWNHEIGVSHRIGDRFKLEGTLFDIRGQNLIRLRWPHYVNSGAFHHTGYETSLHWLPFDGCEINATWSKLDPDDQTLYAPGKKATLAVTVPWRRLSWSLQAQYIQDLYAADYYRQPLPDYSTVAASLTWQIRRSLQMRAMMNNLFDQEYQSLLGYPMPGRNGRVEWTFTW